MRTIKWTACLGAVLAIAGAFVVADAQSWRRGDAAPSFTARGSDGRTHTLRSLTADRPLVLYFIQAGCPVNDRAVTFYNRVAEAYRGRVNFIGVIDADKAGFDAWQARFRAPFTTLLDPDKRIIRAYRARRSPWTILIGRDRRIIEEWAGYSASEISALGAAIARAANVPVRRIDTAGAPASSRAG
jgi:peroxiredoxin